MANQSQNAAAKTLIHMHAHKQEQTNGEVENTYADRMGSRGTTSIRAVTDRPMQHTAIHTSCCTQCWT